MKPWFHLVCWTVVAPIASHIAGKHPSLEKNRFRHCNRKVMIFFPLAAGTRLNRSSMIKSLVILVHVSTVYVYIYIFFYCMVISLISRSFRDISSTSTVMAWELD